MNISPKLKLFRRLAVIFLFSTAIQAQTAPKVRLVVQPIKDESNLLSPLQLEALEFQLSNALLVGGYFRLLDLYPQKALKREQSGLIDSGNGIKTLERSDGVIFVDLQQSGNKTILNLRLKIRKLPVVHVSQAIKIDNVQPGTGTAVILLTQEMQYHRSRKNLKKIQKMTAPIPPPPTHFLIPYRSLFVPGWTQIHKNENAKGLFFLFAHLASGLYLYDTQQTYAVGKTNHSQAELLGYIGFMGTDLRLPLVLFSYFAGEQARAMSNQASDDSQAAFFALSSLYVANLVDAARNLNGTFGASLRFQGGSGGRVSLRWQTRF